MNQELKVMAAVAQTSEFDNLFNRFRQLNTEILELSNEIAFRVNIIKQFPVSNLSNLEEAKQIEPADVLERLTQYLNTLELSKYRLEEIFNHIKTVV